MSGREFPDSPVEAVQNLRTTLERLAESDLPIAEDARRVLEAVKQGEVGGGG